ncbi:aminotransferase-like domain-containing protein [Leeia aquatica]|uniref:Putative 8-amino-7-oxononanoate synthase n=1 Tax=Leeia aquatica TaxID=2725557 RepID=A0A847S2H8_9NEIS|nr:PLP-dependent aminotransferase family protein [Leeia aquatica]NLR76021.1 PLP-dependent aminotransferase family protein [Leeia aquatica]
MTMWIPDLSVYSGPRHQALLMALQDAIQSGRLPAGARLPPQRRLAELLGLNLSTVTRAWREAADRRWIGGETGRGTYVLGPQPGIGLFVPQDADSVIDLTVNGPAYPNPDHDLSDSLHRLMQQDGLAACLRYPTALDWQRNQQALVRWLAWRGIEAEAQQVLLCGGAQHALAAALMRHSQRGDTVLVEALTYPGMMAIARQLGLHLHPLGMDRAGVRPDALEQALRQGIGHLAVLMPTLHNPTTITMPLERRRALVDVLARYPAARVIEEDAYGHLLAEPPPALVSLRPQQVCHVGGLSKTIAPGLRLGYLLEPTLTEAELRDMFHHTSWQVTPLMARLACLWLEDGTAVRRLRWQQDELAQRRRLVQAIWGDSQGQQLWLPEGSPHGWLTLPLARDAEREASRLRQAGVALTAASAFAASRQLPVNGLRLCIGAPASRGLLQQAMRIVRGTLS